MVILLNDIVPLAFVFCALFFGVFHEVFSRHAVGHSIEFGELSYDFGRQSALNGRTARRGVHKPDGYTYLLKQLLREIVACGTHFKVFVITGAYPFSALEPVRLLARFKA